MSRRRSARFVLCVAVFTLLSLPTVLAAQTPQPAAAPPALTYDIARQVIDAAEAEA
jgi:hypothetical protein